MRCAHAHMFQKDELNGRRATSSYGYNGRPLYLSHKRLVYIEAADNNTWNRSDVINLPFQYQTESLQFYVSWRSQSFVIFMNTGQRSVQCRHRNKCPDLSYTELISQRSLCNVLRCGMQYILAKEIKLRKHDRNTYLLTYLLTPWSDGFGGLVVSMLASGTQVCGFKTRPKPLDFSSACLPPEGK